MRCLRIAALFATGFMAGMAGAARSEAASVLTYHGGPDRNGRFVVPTLTFERARSLHLDDQFRAKISGQVYAQPLYWQPPGAGAMLLVATEDDMVYALDAASGREIWRRSLGRPVPRAALPCGNISPLGVTGTPVIDEASQAIYLSAAVEDSGSVHHQVFGLSLKDGAPLPGWPVDVAADGFVARDQGQRGALTILANTLFVPFGGHFGDCGRYRGMVFGISLADPRKVVSWATRAAGAGIWAPGGIASDGKSLFVATGNGFGSRSFEDAEAVIRLAPDLQRSADRRDFFAPQDWQALDARDADLGGTAPLILDVPSDGGTARRALALGKDRKAYLLDRNNLGGIGGQLAGATVARRAILAAPASYPLGNDTMVAFAAPGSQCPGHGRGGDLTVLKITAGSPPAMRTAWCGAVNG